jgi:hypothetical protein
VPVAVEVQQAVQQVLPGLKHARRGVELIRATVGVLAAA